MNESDSNEQVNAYDVSVLFSDPDRWMKGFGRDSYEDHFDLFMKEFREFYMWLDSSYAVMKDDSDVEGIAEEIVSAASEKFDNVRPKADRERFKMTLNMYTVTYIIPGVLRSNNEYAKKQADAICGSWASHFPDSHIKSAGFDQINDGFRRKMCYITTAVCKGLNKPDDCVELRKLKAYRDDYLSWQPGGREMIETYYDIAPTIVKRIAESHDPDSEYIHLFNDYIRPCISFIDNGENEKCRVMYSRMVEELSRKYLVTNTHDRFKKGTA